MCDVSLRPQTNDRPTTRRPASLPVGLTPITDSNLQPAVDMILTDPSVGLATYGHIKWWDTGAVTDMSYLFCTIDYWLR